MSRCPTLLDQGRNSDYEAAPQGAPTNAPQRQPRQIQLSRKRGWRKPANTIVVIRLVAFGALGRSTVAAQGEL